MNRRIKLVLGISAGGVLIFIIAVIIVYVVGAGKAGNGFSNMAGDIYNIPAETLPGETYTTDEGVVYCRIQIGNEVVPIQLDSLTTYKSFAKDKLLQSKLHDLVGESLKYKKKTFSYDAGVCKIEAKQGSLVIDSNGGVVFFEEAE